MKILNFINNSKLDKLVSGNIADVVSKDGEWAISLKDEELSKLGSIIHENNLNVYNKQLMDTLYEKIYVNDQKQKDFIYKFFDNEKMIKRFPNIKIEDVDGNILFFRDYVKDIKPYYYNFRTNSHLKLKYLENVE